ncbi:hypothetical protein DERF_002125 [Dermatophagoides farinae]|uniref:Uncharacterized protein n=1 Tax=Dermatophagoides farinae TaxID=6954 RepID=A0A922ID49_DERFA|nr:hypothetical protein DERF_002125 [Dermatophagoides farinae]
MNVNGKIRSSLKKMTELQEFNENDDSNDDTLKKTYCFVGRIVQEKKTETNAEKRKKNDKSLCAVLH